MFGSLGFELLSPIMISDFCIKCVELCACCEVEDGEEDARAVGHGKRYNDYLTYTYTMDRRN